MYACDGVPCTWSIYIDADLLFGYEVPVCPFYLTVVVLDLLHWQTMFEAIIASLVVSFKQKQLARSRTCFSF